MSNGDQNFSITILTHPLFPDGDRSFSIAKKRGHVIWFWKALNEGFPKKMSRGFQKHMTCPRFLVTKRIRLQSDSANLSFFFNRHPTHPHYWMATKVFHCLGGKNRAWIYIFSKLVTHGHPFRLPSNDGVMLNGNWNFLVTIQWWGYVEWSLKFLLKAFQKHMTCPHFVVIDKF